MTSREGSAQPTSSQSVDITNYYEILGRLDQARSFLSVCHRSLIVSESAYAVAGEADLLADVIERLRRVYNELDDFVEPTGPIEPVVPRAKRSTKRKSMRRGAPGS